MAKRSRRQTMRLRASRARVGRSRGMASHLLIIGSNDLTQLTLGVDRDGAAVAPLFDERNDAVKWSCAHLLEAEVRLGDTRPKPTSPSAAPTLEPRHA